MSVSTADTAALRSRDECRQLTPEFDGPSGDVCVTEAVYLDSEVGDYVTLRTA